jgi:regulatory protein
VNGGAHGPTPGAVTTPEGDCPGAHGPGDEATADGEACESPDPPAPPTVALADAMARAGRMLARRPRTDLELRDRLARAGVGEETAAAAVARLRALRLIDDEEFARRWIEERARRGRSGTALVAELEAKGVDRPVAERALLAAGVDDEAQARLVAEKALSRFARHAPEVQGRRLHHLLLRRGFDPAVAEGVVRALLPPEGWD